MSDCIIIGAGPAGATAAYHLAKQGYQVILLEKATLPRYKACGGGVSPAIAQWFDFDFQPAIDNTITEVRYTWKLGDPVQTKLKMVKPMWMVRRDQFDQFLVKQAISQGAELRENTTVTAIESQGDGWTVKTSQGNFQSSYLIGADGANGPVSKWLGLGKPATSLGASLEIEQAVPPAQLHTAAFEFGLLKNGYIWNFPKSNGYSVSGAILRGNKANSEELKKQIYQYVQESGLNTNQAQYTEYPLTLWSASQPLHTQRALICGEAAGILDPLTGEGIRPGIFTGYQAAQAIGKAIRGDNQALSQYTQIINQEWGADMILAQRLAGIFYQFPKIAYKVGVKRPTAAQIMGKILCGELRYSDVTEQAINSLKKSLIPGMGG